MTAKSLAGAFSSLSAAQQAESLARWSHSLTIDARDTYIAGTEAIADPVRLRGFNEIQHRIAGQLIKILGSDDQRYPEEVFMGMLLDAVKTLRASFCGTELEKLLNSGSREITGKRRAG